MNLRRHFECDAQRDRRRIASNTRNSVRGRNIVTLFGNGRVGFFFGKLAFRTVGFVSDGANEFFYFRGRQSDGADDVRPNEREFGGQMSKPFYVLTGCFRSLKIKPYFKRALRIRQKVATRRSLRLAKYTLCINKVHEK